MRGHGTGGFPWALGATVFLVQVALGVVLFPGFQEFVPKYLDTGDAWPGYLLGAYGAARFLGETPTGTLSDRIERKVGLLVGFACMAPAMAVMAVVRDPLAFLACAALLGLATAFLWPATYAIAADLYPPERRGRVVGFLNFAQLAGFGLGALLGAFVLAAASRAIFPLAAAAVGLAFAATLRYIPAYRRRRLAGVAMRAERPRARELLAPPIVAVGALIFLGTTALGVAVPAIRPYGQHVLRVDFDTLTVALVPAIVVGALAYLPAGHLADRFERWQPLAFGQGIAVCGLLALGSTAELPVASAIAVIIFLGNVLSVPAWNAAMMDLAPPTHRGALIGLAVALSGLGLSVGPVIGGAVVEARGAVDTFRCAALVSGLAAAAAAIYGARFAPRSRPVLGRPNLDRV